MKQSVLIALRVVGDALARPTTTPPSTAMDHDAGFPSSDRAAFHIRPGPSATSASASMISAGR